jgi:hypothetical protein
MPWPSTVQWALLDVLLSTDISLPKFFSSFDQENKEKGADEKVKNVRKMKAITKAV